MCTIERQSNLYYVDIDDSTSDGALSWHNVFVSTNETLPISNASSSPAPISLSALSNYKFDSASGLILTSLGNELLYSIETSASNDRKLLPLNSQSTKRKGGEQLCPCNTRLICYVSCGNIHISYLHQSNGKKEPIPRVAQITTSHKNLRTLEEDTKSSGVPSYIIQEEFDRYQGLFWRPVSHLDEHGVETYSLIYEEVDESGVDIVSLPSASSARHPLLLSTPDNTQSSETDTRLFFSRAGTANAKSRLCLLTFKVCESTGNLIDITHKLIWCKSMSTFDWVEYVVRMGWTPNGSHFYVVLMNRLQNRMETVLTNPFASHSIFHTVDKVEETSFWINVHNSLTFIESSESQVEFITASDNSDHRHLAYVHVDIMRDGGTCETERKLLTSGCWDVCSKEPIVIDTRNSLLYFHGFKDSPVERHCYVTSWKNSEQGYIERLTQLGLSHTVTFNYQCNMFISNFSSLDEAPGCRVFSLNFSDTSNPIVKPVGWISTPINLSQFNYKPPILFKTQLHVSDASNNDVDIFGFIFLPPNIDTSLKYPVILNVYGGPKVQIVTNSFMGIRHQRAHNLAENGYIVVFIDGRGSDNRGHSFERHIFKRVGDVELLDQIQVLKWVAEQKPYFDMSRVAIHGWSYGGYLSIRALALYPDFFKVGVSGAPVCSWLNYDTAYTERYMGLPPSDVYETSSLLEMAQKMPSHPNRLLIIHGMQDDNVHFYRHTCQFISRLIQHSKPYRLQVYPNERHSLRRPESVEHYDSMLVAHLKAHL